MANTKTLLDRARRTYSLAQQAVSDAEAHLRRLRELEDEAEKSVDYWIGVVDATKDLTAPE